MHVIAVASAAVHLHSVRVCASIIANDGADLARADAPQRRGHAHAVPNSNPQGAGIDVCLALFEQSLRHLTR